MNELHDHPNLYLRQHGNNPIHWKIWDSSNWTKAIEENKLVIVSIGYSACHWCHVMEKECFEDHDVALFTNENFISIKVDRESRPDIDQMYMNAIHLMGKPGGWPLNCICLPDGTPIFGGTYFPKSKWLQILSELNHLFQTRKETLDSFANEMKEALNKFILQHQSQGKLELNHDSIQGFIADLDYEWGGTAGYPKFPMPPLITSILQYGVHHDHKASLRWCKITLEKIKFGGIHDLIEGGIARYSVDHRWHIPHFEKMLFDNAQLLSVYAKAHLLFPEQEFDEVMLGIHRWLILNMKQSSGLMSSTVDADSEGEEGKYYSFKIDEIRSAIGEEYNRWNSVFEFENHSYWEEEKIVFSAKEAFSLRDKKWKNVQFELQKIRLKKIKPITDNKVITAWNAQTVIGYCQGSDIFNEWINHAQELYDAMECHLKINGQWIQGKEGNNTITPLLFDTLAWIQKACIELFLKTTSWKYIQEAIEIYQNAEIFKQESTLYCLNAEENVLVKIIETQDNVIPSSNAIWAENLYWLSIITGNTQYFEHCKKMIQCIGQDVNQISYYAHWNLLLQLIDSKAGIIVASQPEPNWLKNKKWLHKTVVLQENVENLFLQGKWQPQTQYSLCTLATCYPPVLHCSDIV